MPTPKPRVYYISDRAYGHLVVLAQKQLYVSYGTEKAKGLSQFLCDLAVIPLEDSRPSLVKERHTEEIRNNRAPTWANTRLRRNRLLKLTDDALVRYFLSAYQVGIIRDKPYAIGGPDRSTPYATVAMVLEAIGLGWLTPIELPNGPKQQGTL